MKVAHIRKWKARKAELDEQIHHYANAAQMDSRMENMVKENERMKMTAASLSHYMECETGDPRSEYEMLKERHAYLTKSNHVMRMALAKMDKDKETVK